MFRMNRKNLAGLALAAMTAVGLTFGLVTPITGQQPAFSATINLDQDLQLCLGDTIDLNASYTTNKDVTKKQWYVNGVAQGVVESIPDGEKSAGSDMFSFTPTGTGVFTVSFRVWHHQQTSRDAQESVVVTVVECTEDCPAAPAIAGAYLKNVKGLRPNDPLFSDIIQEIAHVMHDEFGNDPCAPGYADAVEAYIDSHWMFD